MIRALCPDPLDTNRVVPKNRERMRFFASFRRRVPGCTGLTRFAADARRGLGLNIAARGLPVSTYVS